MISQLLRIVNGYLETETATDESLAEQVSRLREVVTVLAARLDQHFNGGMYDHPEFAQEHHTHGHHTHSELARKELEARRDDARSFGDLIREAKEREKGWPEWMRQPIAPAKKQPSSGLESQPQH